jgi:uncharacterized protein (DUF1499 family)
VAVDATSTRLMWLAMGVLGCAGTPPDGLGVRGAQLAPCPASPNCVCSDARDAAHAVAPLALAAPAERAFELAIEAVAALPRTTIMSRTQDYVHAECRSALFGFVDDLELHLRPESGQIAIRSASRMGYSDLGVNRRRVERLRAALAARGVLHAASAPETPEARGAPR